MKVNDGIVESSDRPARKKVRQVIRSDAIGHEQRESGISNEGHARSWQRASTLVGVKCGNPGLFKARQLAEGVIRASNHGTAAAWEIR